MATSHDDFHQTPNRYSIPTLLKTLTEKLETLTQSIPSIIREEFDKYENRGCLVVYGIPDNADPQFAINSILDLADIAPTDFSIICRLGKKLPNTSTRPVKVRLHEGVPFPLLRSIATNMRSIPALTTFLFAKWKPRWKEKLPTNVERKEDVLKLKTKEPHPPAREINFEMLDCLPNEILLKIFKKTKYETSGQCRLLSSRVDQVIKKDDLFKRKIKKIRVAFVNDKYEIYIKPSAKKKEIQLDLNSIDINGLGYSEILPVLLEAFLQKCIYIEEFSFDMMRITDEVLDVLLRSSCFKKARRVRFTCVMNVSTKKFDELIGMLNLKVFVVEVHLGNTRNKMIFVHHNRDKNLCALRACTCVNVEHLDRKFKQTEFRRYQRLMKLYAVHLYAENTLKYLLAKFFKDDVNGNRKRINNPESLTDWNFHKWTRNVLHSSEKLFRKLPVSWQDTSDDLNIGDVLRFPMGLMDNVHLFIEIDCV